MIQELKNFILNDVKNCKILVVGDVMLDKYYFGEVTRISPEAPVPINHVTKVKETLGGAANVAHNLARLGCNSILIAEIGKDNHGDTFLKKLKNCGVDGSKIFRSNKPTTTKIRVISGHQQMLRLDFEDTSEIQCDEIFWENIISAIKNVHAVIISDYGKGVCTDEICKKIILECRKNKKIVIIDPKGDNWQKYCGASFITPNLKEFNEILPKKIPNVDDEIEQSAQTVIKNFNLDGLLVTRSAKGLSLISEKISHIKAHAQEVFDVSGAGDTVIAVFTLALAGGISADKAALLANIAAGVVVAKVGTYAVSNDELLAILEKNL